MSLQKRNLESLKMRHFRNPKFAMESLERKLNPSGILPTPVAAEVHIPVAHISNATHHLSHTCVSSPSTDSLAASTYGRYFLSPGDSPTTIPDGNGDPPIDPPTGPTGPDQPA
jgi:hypothetical protein